METGLWLKHYDEKVPHTLQPCSEHTLLDVVRDAAHQRPNHAALLFKGASLSRGELDRLSDAFAAALVAQGVQKGDRVPATSSYADWVVICAGHRLGGTAVRRVARWPVHVGLR